MIFYLKNTCFFLPTKLVMLKIAAEIQLVGATNYDFEDIAAGEVDGKPAIFVGDTGNNYHIRNELVFYSFEEPDLGGMKWGKTNSMFYITE